MATKLHKLITMRLLDWNHWKSCMLTVFLQRAEITIINLHLQVSGWQQNNNIISSCISFSEKAKEIVRMLLNTQFGILETSHLSKQPLTMTITLILQTAVFQPSNNSTIWDLQ